MVTSLHSKWAASKPVRVGLAEEGRISESIRTDPAAAHARQFKEAGRKGEWTRRSVGVICLLR